MISVFLQPYTTATKFLTSIYICLLIGNIAIISDIHGNAEALMKVVEDAERQQVKTFVILGDLFVHGPSPERVYEIVKDLQVRYWIMGNHDYYIAKGLIDKPDAIILGKPVKEKKNEKGKSNDQIFADLIDNMHWWREKIGKDKCMKFFSKFKSIATHKQDQGRQQQLIFSHALPWDYEKAPDTQDLAIISRLEEEIRHSSYIYHQPEEQPDSFIYISGHTHIPHYIPRLKAKEKNIYFINPGSVGLPWDGNRKASYCILSEDEPGVPYFRRVVYDINSVIEKLGSRRVPLNYDTKRRLQEALI
jgi:predicted phosphodiesterase